MKITLELSTDGARDAINDLKNAKDYLQWDIEHLLEILAKDGADIAQIADGGMADVVGWLEDDHTAKIQATGDAPVIAEFGAGDATISPNGLFEGTPDVDVYPGSYSEQVGTQEYYLSNLQGQGRWHWGGTVFTEIAPRQGMLKAKQYIIRECTDIAKGVIKL